MKVCTKKKIKKCEKERKNTFLRRKRETYADNHKM
jgi:hypothetical protein